MCFFYFSPPILTIPTCQPHVYHCSAFPCLYSALPVPPLLPFASQNSSTSLPIPSLFPHLHFFLKIFPSFLRCCACIPCHCKCLFACCLPPQNLPPLSILLLMWCFCAWIRNLTRLSAEQGNLLATDRNASVIEKNENKDIGIRIFDRRNDLLLSSKGRA